MATALYRRYRPESFADVIGQSHVTEPLMTALRTNRVNHAYLFSGPRGCGKTTSARILARCLNCAEGPTDIPCGKCPSCIELSRDGGGSLDVVEIDAASHNGVDDARDLRERAVFAPARDRYKIFILDEAHMVTPQGFNALLKLVEEPPEHVKFIFATTEPEKVIGTIRSRTHHYPFRLIPPAQMLEYCESLCASEKISVEPGVLALVVRAGGGSARDTLSLLDQLIAGSEQDSVTYERAVSLLGYTHSALLDEAVDALAAGNSAEAFAAVDRVIQTGQDPRRFVEDLLERLRDLILVAATGANANAVLRSIPADELERMQAQAKNFGSAELSRAADVVNSSLTEMTGATSPRLHLELMIARLLVRATGTAPAGAISSSPAASASASAAAPAAPAVPKASAPAAPPAPAAPAAKVEPVKEAVAAKPEPVVPTGPVGTRELLEAWPAVLEKIQNKSRAAWLVVVSAQVRSLEDDVLTLVFSNEADAASFRPQKGIPGGVHEILRQAIIDTVGVRVAFKVSSDTTATAPIDRLTQTGSVATESAQVNAPREFATPAAAEEEPPLPEEPPADLDDEPPYEDAAPAAAPAAKSVAPAPTAAPAPAAVDDDGWDVVAIPGSGAPAVLEEDVVDEEVEVAVAVAEPAAPTKKLTPEQAAQEDARYGEAVVREILDAKFIAEEVTAPIPTVAAELDPED
ncbi:DNA polymerase III subunit gamma and tau [Aurantimicrobium minutum]|uniref:DNA polymerase III subunit gamma and tau n=1 Tax=Aurantimicrobium minutum TaxID=708131 RepID=UPI0024739600|nr:DNA polymerase III subunit gamma and tau [Aurantimicrobium minutum]MDH6423676.1 DNA polymerase-3 subunit gamma/tau [Aurantimicrobium minutum]